MATKKEKKPAAKQRPPLEAGKRATKNMKPGTKTEEKKGPTVVGIGASAGGLHALQSFFDNLPGNTGMAFVVVTHLHPEYESHLAELLQSHTEMSVAQVQGMTPVKSNHVYVMPPNRRVLITDSHLDLVNFVEPRGRRTPIDQFYRSLAAAHSDAIGVILSGSGTDGSVGIKDIKENGGLLLVQKPEEAEYDGMPRAAISTGLADLVLPVAELAGKLLGYSRHEARLPIDPEDLTEGQQDSIERILAQVHSRTGNDFGQYKRSTILRRVQRRMHLNGHSTLESYLEYLRQHGNEATAMFNDILIGVTNFFRDRTSWEALNKSVIPALFENKQTNDPIRVWSIGCASGEEAYGLAMMLSEYASGLDRRFEIQVFASDLAEASLTHARDGVYPTAIEADVSPERLERFFSPEGNHYRVKRELRDMVLFTNHNILRDPPFSHIDLIVCRNLLIYLKREVQENIFGIIHYALRTGGFLFLGNSESTESVPDLFTIIDKSHRIYRSRPWRGQQPHLPVLPLMIHSREGTERLELTNPRRKKHIAEDVGLLQEHASMLESHGAPSLIVDDQYTILHVSETAGRYLLQPKGPPTRELLKLVRPELQTELHTALFQAFERDQAILSQPVRVKFNGASHPVIVSVRPRRHMEGLLDRQALVIFLEDESEGLSPAPLPHPEDEANKDSAMVLQREGEVQRLREQLQVMVEQYNSSNEEMRAANEELQSINEEYRSTTEELETSKEELQSVNEELQTVNNELKSKLDEISRTNSDLENLMAASEIATLFLSRDLHIKRYTAGMDQVLNLLPSDRGRPIGHFANKLGYDELIEDAEQVVHKLVTLERELKSKTGRWYQVSLRPYRTVDHRIDGVVITFVDVTELKQTQKALQVLNEALQVRVDERTGQLDQANLNLIAVNELFTTLFHSNPIPTSLNRLADWTFLNVNDAYLKYFGVDVSQVIGQTALEFGFAPNASLRMHMRKQLEKTGLIRHMELELPTSNGETRTVIGSMQRVQAGGEDRVISAFMDISERVKAEQQIRTLASQLNMAEQHERHRISQILHDELQQQLFAVRMQLSMLREAVEDGNKQVQTSEFPLVEKAVSEAIEMTRSLSIELSPAILEGEGLYEAIVWLSAQMEEKFGLKVSTRTQGMDPPLEPSLRVLLYQIVHELLFNVVKHSGTLAAEVLMQQNAEGLILTVRDQGTGFDTKAVLAPEAALHGLRNIDNRLKLMGCTMTVKSNPGKGTETIIEVPPSWTKVRK
jgi:two-component system CheB/CheR fusion protein